MLRGGTINDSCIVCRSMVDGRKRMRERNCEVVRKWFDSETAQNHRNTLTTNGSSLWSYGLCIGDTCKETNIKILRDHTSPGKWPYHSQTTSCHVNLTYRESLLHDDVELLLD